MLLAKMAVIHLSLLATIWFFISTAAAEQNCESRKNWESIASEFKPKASEEGVRMIYLNLKMSLPNGRGSWVVGTSRGSWVWVWVKVVDVGND